MTHVTDEQLGKIARQQADLFRRVREGTLDVEGVSRRIQDIIESKPVGAGALLRQVGTVVVGGVERFVAKEHLAEANIGWTGIKFNRFFLNLVEENIEGTTLNIHRLEKASLDVSILAELGVRARISLAHFFELLKRQSKGEPGLLLTEGDANIAYVIGNDGNFWAVSAFWSRNWGNWGLTVTACSIDDSDDCLFDSDDCLLAVVVSH